MSKKSTNRLFQVTALSFAVSAVVLSVACAPKKVKSVPVTKAAVDKLHEAVADSTQRAYPTFHCTSPAAVDLSNRIQGATVLMAAATVPDPTVTGTLAEYHVRINILVTDHDSKVTYALSDQGNIGNDGKTSNLDPVDPTNYASHPENNYAFQASCKAIGGKCKAILVHIYEKVSNATTEQTSVRQKTITGRETVLVFSMGRATATVPAASPTPAPLDSDIVTMPMAWKPGPPARGRCTASKATNSFERASENLPPVSPFDRAVTPTASPTPDAADIVPESVQNTEAIVEAPPVPKTPEAEASAQPQAQPVQSATPSDQVEAP